MTRFDLFATWAIGIVMYIGLQIRLYALDDKLEKIIRLLEKSKQTN